MKKLIIFTISLLISQTATCMDIFDAAEQGNVDRVRELIDHNAAVDARDTDNWTPLHYAARGSRAEQLLEDWPFYQRARIRHPECLAAFSLANHPQCGQNSPARVLPVHSYEMICKLVLMPKHTFKQIHQIAEQERNLEQPYNNETNPDVQSNK